MPRFLLVRAATQPGSNPPIPYLVGDVRTPGRFVGARLMPPPPEVPGQKPKRLGHLAQAYEAVSMVVEDADTYRKEAQAKTLEILGETEADTITAARAALAAREG